MKKLFISMILVAVSLGLFAHSASSVKLRYETKNQRLYVEFDHGVKKVMEHYIFNIEVKVNDKLIITQKALTQDTITGGSLVYKLAGLVVGDKIMVTVECNKGGKQSGSLVVK